MHRNRMAPISARSRSYPPLQSGFKVATLTTVVIIFSLIILILLPKSGGSVSFEESRELVIGSKPPVCANKCMNCRPCMPTVVVPNHQNNNKAFSTTQGEINNDSYYLLSWKCTCGDNFFQP